MLRHPPGPITTIQLTDAGFVFFALVFVAFIAAIAYFGKPPKDDRKNGDDE